MISFMNMNKKKIISLICVISLLFVCPHADAKNKEQGLWQEQKRVIHSFRIPNNLAAVKEANGFNSEGSVSPFDSFVVLIQDVHLSPEAQFNISKLIELFVRDFHVKLIGYEGNEGIIETEKVFWYPDRKLKDIVSNELLQDLRLSGPEHARVNSPNDFVLFGVDDNESYGKNLELFRKALSLRQEGTENLHYLRGRLREVLLSTASDNAIEFFATKEEKELDENSLQNYLNKLLKIAQKENIKIREKTPLISGLCDGKLISPKQAENIKPEDLFREIENIELLLEGLFFRGPREIKIIKVLKDMEIMKDIISLKATREEWEYYSKCKKRQAAKRMKIILRDILPSDLLVRRSILSLQNSLESAETFYSLAVERDNIMVESLLKRWDKKEKCVLVAGGFHTEGITNLLERMGIPYVVLCPKFSEVTDRLERLYLKSISDYYICDSDLFNLASGNVLRQPTLFNIGSDKARLRVNFLALRILGSMDPRDFEMETTQIYRDIYALKSREGIPKFNGVIFRKNNANSLGDPGSRHGAHENEIWEEFLRKSVLIPSRVDFDDNVPETVQEVFAYDGGGNLLRQNVREGLYEGQEILSIAGIGNIIKAFQKQTAGVTDFMEFAFIAGLPESIVIEHTDEERIVKINLELFANPDLLQAALVEVLTADSLYGELQENPFIIKVYSVLMALEFIKKQIWSKDRDRAVSIFQASERYSLLAYLSSQGGIQREVFSGEKTGELLFKMLEETFLTEHPDGSDLFEKHLKRLREAGSEAVNNKIRFIKEYAAYKSITRTFETALSDGSLNRKFAQKITQERQPRYLQFLAKTRRFGLLINLLHCLYTDVVTQSQGIAMLYAGLDAENTNPYLVLNPEELANALLFIARQSENFKDSFLDIAAQTYGDYLVENGPHVNEEKIKKTVRILKEKMQASSLGGSAQEINENTEMILQIDSEMVTDGFFVRISKFLILNPGLKITLLAEKRDTAEKIKRSVQKLKLPDDMDSRINCLVNKLRSERDIRNASDYIDYVKTRMGMDDSIYAENSDGLSNRIALIADYEICERINPGNSILLAKDKAFIKDNEPLYKIPRMNKNERSVSLFAIMEMACKLLNEIEPDRLLGKMKRLDGNHDICLPNIAFLKKIAKKWQFKRLETSRVLQSA